MAKSKPSPGYACLNINLFKKKGMMRKSLLFATALLALSCARVSDNKADLAIPVAFQDNEWHQYWYAGDAEVNVYEVEQARYAEVHPGTTVLVFVTEDFLTDKQVKNEKYENANSTSVLKTNLIQNFTTGLYDYSIMSSVFTPVDVEKYPSTFKVTTTSQDWCGHSFMQLNHRKNKLKVSQYSYFESEGDKIFDVTSTLIEDELLNRIRIDPNTLPSGTNQILPSTVFARLKHIEYKPYTAQFSKISYAGKEFTGDDLQVYKIVFPDLNRTKEIIYESDFPHHIVGWTDEYPVVMSGEKLRTIARKKSSKKLAYWSKHNLQHSDLRSELGL